MFSLQSSPPPSGAAGETLRADAAAPSHLYGARCLHALSTLPQPAGVQDPAAATAPSQRQTSVGSWPLLMNTRYCGSHWILVYRRAPCKHVPLISLIWFPGSCGVILALRRCFS
uniref:Uncharacterized protein n=1 Tax=Zea mays TaxID=4577 RepID=A0A804QVY3_MAIZE